MRAAVLNAFCAVLLMIAQSNFDAAFGVNIMCQFGLIALVLACGVGISAVPAAVSLMIVALVCDMWASGPGGLYAFVMMLVFVLFRIVMSRIRSERVIAMMIYAAVAVVVFEWILAGAYAGIYRSTIYLSICLRRFWADALVTAAFVPIVMALLQLLDRIFTARRHSGLA